MGASSWSAIGHPAIVFECIFRYLSPHLYDFLEALITQQTSPDEAYRKFDAIASKHTEQLRKYTKQVQEARNQHDDEAVKRAINEYEDALGRYIPVLMAQAKIYWDLEMYQQVCWIILYFEIVPTSVYDR